MQKALSKKIVWPVFGVLFLAAVLVGVFLQPYTGDSAIIFNFAKVLFIGALFVLFAACVYLLTQKEIKYEWLFTGLVLGFGMIYLFALTPLSGPDEIHHYQSAYTMSNLIMGREFNLGDAAAFDYSHVVPHYNTAFSYLEISKNFFTKPLEMSVMTVPGPRKVNYLLEYLLPALFISVGRLFGANSMMLMQLGRLGNFILTLVCLFFAIKLTPKFKMLFGMIFLLPMSLQQSVSMSYDCYVNAMTILTVALLFRGIFGKGKLKVWELVLLCVIGLLQAPSKTVYAFVILAAFWIPSERFNKKWMKWVFTSVLVLACLGFSLYIYKRPVRASVGGDRTYYEAAKFYTFGWIGSHIGETLKILGNTFIENGPTYIAGALGYWLCGFTLTLPKWVIVAAALLMIVSVLCEAKGEVGEVKQPLGQRITFIGIGIVIALIIIVQMMVAFTYEGREVIDGVQGRYFLPTASLVLSACCIPKLKIKENANRYLILGMVALQVVCVFSILATTAGAVL